MSVKVTVLKTPVTVAFRKQGRKWYAVALQFDLVGIGSTKKKAFDTLKGVVNEYLDDCLEEEGPVEFYFPSEPSEWNCKDKKSYWVTAITAQPEEDSHPFPECADDLSELYPYRDRIESFDLSPVGVGVA